MKNGLLFLMLFSFVLISGCLQQEDSKVESVGQPDEKIQATPQTSSSAPRLGNLCLGEEECISFCQNNRGRCEEYCKSNVENELCQQLYPRIVQLQEKPVLSLPFAENDNPVGIVPMGETITHNGEPHVGIDFSWKKETKILKMRNPLAIEKIILLLYKRVNLLKS